MAGGTEDDTYFVDSASDAVLELAGQGTNDRVFASASFTLGSTAEIESLGTTASSGTSAINLGGSNAANAITGNAGANVLIGFGGNDTLNGLGGNDTMTGGTGQDAFLFNAALNAATNVDTVTDFSVADDTIRLENAIFTRLGAGVLASGAFAIGTAAQDANDHVIYDSTTGALLYDADGNGAGAAVQFAQLATGLALTSLDFLVV
jgi:Ca2+-binding RTX toxin-like protein